MKKRFEVISNSEVLDKKTDLIWQRHLSQEPMSFAGAKRYLEKFVQNWRLPTVKELLSLIDYGEFNPALPVGHPFKGVILSWYWSGTSVRLYPDSVWNVDLCDGDVFWDDGGTGLSHVWLVRDNN